ncbi:DoxX family membrane protein [Streptomyces sp. TR06-5]|uniref:DoxX family protein n=1 Tax=Streptomyces sp. TR06-5 TaxID=3385976 RepID=UPI0039A1AC53
MSVDTRTPRPSPGGTPRGFLDDEPVLSTVKVPSDPGQVVVNHVSFRVVLPGPLPRSSAVETPRLRAARAAVGLDASPVAGATAPGTARRRAPVVWSGRAAPGDAGTARLLQAVRVPPTGLAPVPHRPGAGTRTLPRPDDGAPTIVGPREPGPSETTQPLPRVAPSAGGRAAAPPGDVPPGGTGPSGPTGPQPEDTGTRVLPEYADPTSRRPRRNDPVRHAFYPGRRMNLGIVLLPLRLILGFVSVYAGMGKLSDPVYFDGGDRGSMVSWLQSLEPWSIASPLHAFAVSHPVGAGLTIAFLQIIVGVLTLFGLWQRLAAGVGAALSVALLVTVAWSSVPVYDAPDMLFLAAWSPLVIAGAPVYSLDARLAGEAWRTLGPRAELWDLRGRVLRRGIVLASLVAGSALLAGSLLGGAVRSSEAPRVSEPGEPPVNHLPGSPLPREPKEKKRTSETESSAPEAEKSPEPSASSAGTPGGSGETSSPSQQETVQAPQQPAAPAPQETVAEPSSSGTSSTGPSGDDSTGGTGGTTDGSSGGGEPERGGALGGLLG